MEKLKLEELNRKSVAEFKAAAKLPVIVVLDNVRSMNNTGSVFRTADAFLMEKIILCGITGQPPHRDINKTALGATESVDWEYEEDVVIAAQDLMAQGYKLLGIEQTTGSISLKDFTFIKGEKYALFFGNEVEGLSSELLLFLDAAIEIPQGGTKHSLNVSVAAGIVMFEVYEGMKINRA